MYVRRATCVVQFLRTYSWDLSPRTWIVLPVAFPFPSLTPFFVKAPPLDPGGHRFTPIERLPQLGRSPKDDHPEGEYFIFIRPPPSLMDGLFRDRSASTNPVPATVMNSEHGLLFPISHRHRPLLQPPRFRLTVSPPFNFRINSSSSARSAKNPDGYFFLGPKYILGRLDSYVDLSPITAVNVEFSQSANRSTAPSYACQEQSLLASATPFGGLLLSRNQNKVFSVLRVPPSFCLGWKIDVVHSSLHRYDVKFNANDRLYKNSN